MPYEMTQITPPDYPPSLREIPEPPKTLWMQGTLPTKTTKVLAVVGSRAATGYGKEAVSSLIKGLLGYPISIVSGLALGIDATAHEAALDAGIHTIAIPGSGLDESVLYPRANRGIASRILLSGGALISEHEPKYRAHPYDFPSRNRIMVGLADAVLIVEAAKRSGTLITARLASEYNRDLLCIPHRIGDSHGFGAHLFLRLGATLVTEPLHILEALGIPPNKKYSSEKRVPNDLSKAESVLYNALSEPRSRDEVIRVSQIPTSDALTALVSLELRGLIKEEYGAWRRA
ncbi:Rossmann fold nucleotide-binding protein Smf possibly involved in DNA uptake [hydrothermal vent metagenome]|uniref:Rossmann fold nucleotide-binding protein Smf possibly involved in DNA uptake n=1 Tax=hydrothermal vent metagenome TaxID=652676 RepID=A0A3B0URT0_9ZZZZ